MTTALARAAFEAAIALAEEPLDQQGLVPALAGLARVLADDEPDRAAALAARAASVEPVLGHVKALLARRLGGAGPRRQGRGGDDRPRGSAKSLAARRDRPGIAESLELTAARGDDA